MAELLASASSKVRGLSSGQKINGVVSAKTPRSLILDIGGKSEGMVAEKAFIEARDFIKTLKIGDTVTATVLIPENRDGVALLSLRQAAFDSSWERLEKAKQGEVAVAVFGKGVNPSGVTVDVDGLTGFIPGSQLGKETSKNPQNLVGKYFKAVPLEVERLANKVVLSEKEVSDAADIKVAIEGLVHISELAWGKVGVTSDAVSEGDKVKVKVIGVKEGRLSLSIKAALKDPWQDIAEKYKTDSKVEGKVTRVSDFGAFVEVEPGVEGLIHITNIPPGQRLSEGQEVNCYVQEVDAKGKKLSLGLVLTSKPIGYK